MQLQGAARPARAVAALGCRPCATRAALPVGLPTSGAARRTAVAATPQLQRLPLLARPQLPRSLASTAAAAEPAVAAAAAKGGELPPWSPAQRSEYIVMNAFHLVDIGEPGRLVGELKAAAEGRDVRGRIYVSEQGLNAQFGGKWDDAIALARWIEAHPTFQGVRFNSDPTEEHLYPRLRVQYKPNLISMAGGMAGVPVTDPAARAEPVPPSEWKRMLLEAQNLPPEQRPVVLDLRNSYEWDAGHFIGAERPLEDNFHETPTEVTEEKVPDYVRDVDPERPVMMYCTGGIRCDVYSAYLKSKGYNKLYTLDRGVHNYFRQEGADCWDGSLYVFDARMAIRPDTPAGALPAAAPCQLCGGQAVLPHMNCANVDCNKLFISCDGCKTKYRGCCCPECTDAPRLLRPAKTRGVYGNFSQYVPEGEDTSAVRGPSRISKRRKRQQLLREREKEERAAKMERRRLAKEAMAQRAQQEPSALSAEVAEHDARMARLRELRQRLVASASA